MTARCRVCGANNTGLLLRERCSGSGRDYLHCARCDCVFVPDEFVLSVDEERARYLLHENDPADRGYRRFLGRLLERVVPLVAPGAEGLDYGCGEPAVLAEMLRAAGLDVTGYDLYFRPDDAALQRDYDFIVCSETAEHFREPLGEFRRLEGMLRAGGILGVMTGMPECWSGFEHWHYRHDKTHICFYSPRTMGFIAETLGLRCELPSPDVAVLRR